MTNPFHSLNQRTAEQIRTARMQSFEHHCVLGILRQLRHPTLQRRMIAEQRRLGRSFLTLEDFNRAVDFPVWLECDALADLPQPLHLLPQAVLPNWLKSFMGLPFVARYEKFFDALEGGERTALAKPLGLIFPRHGFQRGLVLHNGGLAFLPAGGSCFLHRGKGVRAVELIVQPLNGFIAHILSSDGFAWQPV